jgi:adenine deaminase
MMNSLKECIAIGRGEKKADIVLKNGQLINVFSGEVYPADVAIHKEQIAGIGDYSGKEEIDLNGRYVAPGFIDPHIHIESSLLTPPQLAYSIVPHGTTTLIAGPHEIVNVLGVEGFKYMLDVSSKIPLDIFFSVPSCVPASEFELAGSKISKSDIVSLLKKDRVIKLGEMMNFPGVLSGKKDVLEKIEAAINCGVEGHAPGLTGKDLNAYIAAGIYSDHETMGLEEAREKLRLGMQVLVREGSSAKNMEAILPLITPANSRFFCFCTDDIYPSDLAKGHLNRVLQKAVSLQLNPVTAIQMVTINPSRFYNLRNYGAIAPGYFADINVLSNLEDFGIDMVFKKGKKVAAKGCPLFEVKMKKNLKVRETMHVKPFEVEALQVNAKSDYAKAIEIVPDQIYTKSITAMVKKQGKLMVSDTGSDILKLVVVERHKATGKMGIGLVKGFGLKKGALATSFAHDAHNIVCVGVDDEDIISAIRRVVDLGGGKVVVRGGLVLADMPLPIAGLMSDKPLDKVVEQQHKLEEVTADLGCKLEHPFGELSFLTLSVIPELKLTALGLVDVKQFKLVDLFE